MSFLPDEVIKMRIRIKELESRTAIALETLEKRFEYLDDRECIRAAIKELRGAE